MADVLANDSETARVRFGGDRVADHTDQTAWRDRPDHQVQAIESALRDRQLFLVDLADQKRFALIAMPAIDDGRDVDVDDVAVAKLILAGNPVADDVVDAGATTLGVALVPERRGTIALIEGPLVDQAIDLFGRRAGDDVRPDIIQQSRVGSPGGPHQVALGMIQKNGLALFQHRGHW